MKKSVVIDFDGTICKHAFPECGLPEPGVQGALIDLHEMGFEVCIHSCRTARYWTMNQARKYTRLEHIQKIHTYMAEHSLHYDKLITEDDKPIATYYIDDKGIGYRGDWDKVIRGIKNYSTSPSVVEQTVFYGELQVGDRFKYNGDEYIKANLHIPVNLSDGSMPMIANHDKVIQTRRRSK